MSNKIVRLFLNTDMRCQHVGLSEVARKKKVNLTELENGEHVIFINVAQNRVKLYSKGNIISYLWRQKGRIDLDAIQMIPQAFDRNGKVDIDSALRTSIEKRLFKKNRNTAVAEILASVKRRKEASNESHSK